MGLILLLVIIEEFLNSFPSPTSTFTANWPDWFYLLMTGVILVALIFSQIYRYRRISTPVQRQQTKWIVSGITAVVGFYIGLYVISLLFPSLHNQNSLGVAMSTLVLSILYPVIFLLIPLSIGFSILRYRLYDIDLLINRTLVYGTLTVSLALVYVGLVFGLQAFVHLFAGQVSQSPIVIVASTLAIAALFQPLRRRIQATIDRRFFRRKYDATRTLKEFSGILRNEVDLTQLREQLVAVIEETMQPTHVSLWLRPPEPSRKRKTWLQIRIDEEEGLVP